MKIPNKNKEKLKKLKLLKAIIKFVPVCLSALVAVVGYTIFAFGLICILSWKNYPVGIALIVIGLVIAFFTYFVYERISILLKQKLGAKIIHLENDLSQ